MPATWTLMTLNALLLEGPTVAKNREKPIAGDRRSLELNPENRNAVQALDRLGASQ